MTSPTTAVGFVGLGTMGSALSAHLLAAGWRVTGYDIDPARLAAHAGRSSLLRRVTGDRALRARQGRARYGLVSRRRHPLVRRTRG